MKRKRATKTSIVPLVVLQAACAGAASVTPACGKTEANSADGSTSTSTSTNTVSIGMGGTVIVLAVSGFGGNVIALAVSGFGGVPNTTATGTPSSLTTSSTASTTSGPVGAGGTLVVLAIAGFGGQLGEGGDAGAIGEGGEAGARESLDRPGTDGQGSN